MSESVENLFQNAVAAVRAGQNAEAKQMLIQVLKASPRNESAWIWMSAAVETNNERIHCLRQVLAINPQNEMAIKGLRALGALQEPAPTPPPPAPEPEPEPEPFTPAPITEPEAPLQIEYSFGEPEEEPPPPVIEEPIIEEFFEPEDTLDDFVPQQEQPFEEMAPQQEDFVFEDVSPQEEIFEEVAPPPVEPPPAPEYIPVESKPIPPLMSHPAPDGVPMVSEDMIAKAASDVSGILSTIETGRRTKTLNISWAPYDKLRGQARGRLDLRPTPMMMIIGASVALVIVVIVIFSQISSTIRENIFLANITPSPTPTITSTPVPTVTPIPTRTPTPEGRELPDEPRLPLEEAPRGDLAFGITLTPPYLSTPHRSNPPMEEAIIAFHEGRYDDTLDLVAQARERESSGLIDSYYLEAMSHFYLGDVEQAQDIVDTALRENENFAPLYFAQGKFYLDDDDVDSALEAYLRAIEIDPQYIAAYVGLAEIYTVRGNYQAAIAQVETVRTFRKYDITALLAASEAYLAQGDAENAASYANLAYYIDPGAEETILAVARGRLALDINDLTVIELENYLRGFNPSSAGAWALLGRAYARVGRVTDAQMAFSRAFDLTDESMVYIERAKFYYEQGKYELALEDLESGLEDIQAPVDLLMVRAKIAFAMADYETAVSDIETLKQLNPALATPSFKVLYARALIETNDAQLAYETASEALTLNLTDEQRAYMLEVRGRALMAQSNFSGALVDINDAMAISETGSRHYYRALALEGLGSIAQAIQELEWVAFWDQSFGYPFADDAAIRLQALRNAAATGG